MDLGGAFRYSTGFGAIEEGLISNGGRNLRGPLISDSGRRVPAEYGQESHASSSVEEWTSPCLSSCSRSASCKMPGWMKHKLESRLLGEVSVTSDM